MHICDQKLYNIIYNISVLPAAASTLRRFASDSFASDSHRVWGDKGGRVRLEGRVRGQGKKG
jgi:hypothetical protein